MAEIPNKWEETDGQRVDSVHELPQRDITNSVHGLLGLNVVAQATRLQLLDHLCRVLPVGIHTDAELQGAVSRNGGSIVDSVYHNVFAVLGFILSVPWIYFFVSQLNDLIKLFGMMFGLSDNFLGLTLLAWGNSIGDMVSNVTMAKRGLPRVGFSACFGGPPTNLLLGIGLPFTYHFIKEGINSASLGMIIMCVVL